jgi:hypothetical protein
MDTLLHDISHLRFETEAREDENLVKLLGKKVIRMFNKESHTVGEYILLYSLVFSGLLLFLLFMEFLVL